VAQSRRHTACGLSVEKEKSAIGAMGRATAQSRPIMTLPVPTPNQTSTIQSQIVICNLLMHPGGRWHALAVQLRFGGGKCRQEAAGSVSSTFVYRSGSSTPFPGIHPRNADAGAQM